MWQNFLLFKGCIKFHYMYMPHMYPFICPRKFTFLPPSYVCECCDEQRCANLSLRSCFEFFWSRIVASDIMLFLMFLRSAVWKNIFHNGCSILYSYLHYARVPTSLLSLLTLDIFCSFDNGPSKGYEMVGIYLWFWFEFLLCSVML